MLLLLPGILLLYLCDPGLGQVCPSSRGLSSTNFGHLAPAGQGVNESFAYVVFLLDITSAGGVGSLTSMQQVEAALWSISSFHSRFPSLLPGVTLGALVLDSNASGGAAAQLVANLHTCEVTFGSSARRVYPRDSVAFVSAETALSVLSELGKPTLSYHPAGVGTATLPSVARLSPSDSAEVEALVQMALALKLPAVQLVFSSDPRRSVMGRRLASRLESSGICVANGIEFSSTSAVSVNSLPSVRPVVLLLSWTELSEFSASLLALRPGNGAFSWILTSEHADSLLYTSQSTSFFDGSLLLQQFARVTNFADFQSQFRSLRPEGKSATNPWLAQFWWRHFNCSSASNCSGSESLRGTQNFPADVVRVAQAADLSLHSLELARRAACGSPSSGLCVAFRTDPSRFSNIYRSLFTAQSLSYTDVQLSAATGAPAAYTLLIHNLQLPGKSWTTVGSVLTGSVALTAAPAAYGAGSSNSSWTVECDAACQSRCPGIVTAVPSTASVSTPAATTSVVGANFSSFGELRFRQQHWVYALIVCGSCGAIASLLFLIYILISVLRLPPHLKNFNTLWSGQFLLLLLLLGYSSLFAWTPWPTVTLCSIIRFAVGFEYSAIFSILIVKLLNLMNEHLSPTYQVLLFFFAVAVQICISLEWLLLVPSAIGSSARCAHKFTHHLATLSYCAVLMVGCVLLAMRTHRIGRNNRESIFIGVAAGLSLPTCLAWTLVGSLNASEDFQDASMAFGLFINLTLILLTIFIPKVVQLRRLEFEDSEETELGSENDEFSKDPIYVLAAPSILSDAPPPSASGPPSLPEGRTEFLRNGRHPTKAYSDLSSHHDFPDNKAADRTMDSLPDRPHDSLPDKLGFL